jgi:hypothetical protein
MMHLRMYVIDDTESVAEIVEGFFKILLGFRHGLYKVRTALRLDFITFEAKYEILRSTVFLVSFIGNDLLLVLFLFCLFLTRKKGGKF